MQWSELRLEKDESMIDHRLRQNNIENPVLGLAKNSFRTPRMLSDRDDEVLLGEETVGNFV
jgi:hypothetical protein